LRPLRRTAMVVDGPGGIDLRAWPTVIDVDEAFYFKPEAGGLLLSPADETPVEPCDAQPDEMDIAVGVDRVMTALDVEVRRIRRSWAGLRTFAPDRTPVIGFDKDLPGFFWCAGQGGYGIQTSPAMARTAAALAQGRTIPADILAEGLTHSALSPGRLAPAPRKQ
jgi:D-arginine dehydrogenase